MTARKNENMSEVRIFVDKEQGVYEIAIWDGGEWVPFSEVTEKEAVGYELKLAARGVRLLKKLEERRLQEWIKEVQDDSE